MKYIKVYRSIYCFYDYYYFIKFINHALVSNEHVCYKEINSLSNLKGHSAAENLISNGIFNRFEFVCNPMWLYLGI